METHGAFSTEMDEMMVQDAGILSDVQDEVVLGEETVETSSAGPADSISLLNSSRSSVIVGPMQQSAVAEGEGSESSEEIMAPPPVKPSPKKTAGRKLAAPKKLGTPKSSPVRRGRSAAAASPIAPTAAKAPAKSASKAKVAEKEPDGGNSEGKSSVATSETMTTISMSSEAMTATSASMSGEATTTTSASSKSMPTRSSGRSSRKKFDPDFLYDETTAFGGGVSSVVASAPAPVSARKRAAVGPSILTPVGGFLGAKSKVPVAVEASPVLSSPAADVVAVSSSLAAEALPDSGVVTAAVASSPIEDERAESDLVAEVPAVDVSGAPLGTAELEEKDEPIQKKLAGKGAETRRRTEANSNTGSAGESNSKKPRKPAKVYCICKKPYDKGFMISCDTCSDWFHGTCVDVTKKEGDAITREKRMWQCPPCSEKNATSGSSQDVATPEASKSHEEPSSYEFPLPVNRKRSKSGSTAAEERDAKSVAEAGTTTAKTPDARKTVKKTRRASTETGNEALASSSSSSSSAKQTPSPKKTPVKEVSLKVKPASEAKPKEVKLKAKPEEAPPMESDTSGLTLLVLGKPIAAGSRSLRHTHLAPSIRPPTILKPGSLFASDSPTPKPVKALASPLLKSPNPLHTSKPTPPVPAKPAVKPESRVIKPESRVTKPESRVTKPESRVTKPGGSGHTESAKTVTPSKPPHPPAKLNQGLCVVCKRQTGKPNSLYCNVECIRRHATEALDWIKPTSSGNTPADRIPVVDRLTGLELTGNEAPLRTGLAAWLEGHQTSCVNKPHSVLLARAEKAMQEDSLDSVRYGTRVLLRDHLLSRWRDAPDLRNGYTEQHIEDIATGLETGLYEKFKDTNAEYKKKYRAIVLNIQDKKNENFYRRLITGVIPAEEVASLSQEQMASDSLTQWRHEVERKELDSIIKAEMEEQMEHRPIIKKTHRGDEVMEDELLEDNDPHPDQQPNLHLSQLADPTADAVSSDARANFSPAVLLSPVASDSGLKSPGYSFSSGIKSAPGGTPSSSSSANHGTSPDQADIPGPSRVNDGSEEALKLAHKTHAFEISCKFCTNSFATISPGPRAAPPNQSPKNEFLPRRTSAETQPSMHSPGDAGGGGFKFPVGGSPSTVERKRKHGKTDADESSPVSSTSEYSPNSEGDIPAGMIWQGDVDTKDLPAARLQAFSLFGKAGQFMAELPNHLDQLGRIQPSQLWPYLDQVKPLKDIAIVLLKSPPGRVTAEFNSLHYFLTTRSRVSVLGPLPTSFKDFYMIALKENEPLPESLCFPELTGFDVEHGKILIGIIVHHRSVRAPVVGRGIFDIPVSTAVAEKRISPYPSPENPDTFNISPGPQIHPYPSRKHDPIVSRFLGMEGVPVTAATVKADSPDTSEPMDIEDDSKAEDEKSSKAVSVPDLLKLVSKLPSKTQVALGLAPTKAKLEVAPPVDPRMSRLNQPTVVAEPEVLKTHPIQINLAMSTPLPSLAAPPSVAVPESMPSTSQSFVKPRDSEDIDTSFGFSKKFIENLAKIEFPEGLKEALRSMGSTSTTLQPMATEVPPATAKPSLLGAPPSNVSPYSVPPPNFPIIRPPPSNYSAPPPNLRPPFPQQQGPQSQFSQHVPPPGFHEGPPPGFHEGPPPGFNERFPQRGFPPNQPNQQPPPDRWSGPPPPHQQQHPFNNSDRTFGAGGTPYPPNDSFGGYAPPSESRWGDRPDRDMGGGARRRSSPPPMHSHGDRRDRRDSDRRRDGGVGLRDGGGGRRGSEERDRGGRDRDRPRSNRRDERPSYRRRSRSRSPRRSDRDRDRRRDDRGSSGRHRDDGAAAAVAGGVDEFGRDVSLRRQLSKSESRDRELRSAERSCVRSAGEGASSVADRGGRSSMDRVSEEDKPRSTGDGSDHRGPGQSERVSWDQVSDERAVADGTTEANQQ
ncbi:putative PHD finger protein 3 [Hypsibius exemplaris]|uniref:PHD finger protein 3 n=1 Tax=Hypsibius exemplaris TaxID=2072580 RepID=A0A9X6NEE9_HYPEX|nr:putative PHD finger protein 3 [Hypsibius exemplaris]